ncbi:MAG: ATPase, T2SS/T4P/T4SS family [Candidatus Heimdallarchaeaceae archaeon]|jgi:type IV secretory pathway ATPase VirB11/archaellum biosynthesis ATPase
MNICQNRTQDESMDDRLISEYRIDGHRVRVSYRDQQAYYSVEPIFDFNQEPLLFAELSSLIHKNKGRLAERILKFDELTEVLKSILMWKILEINNLPINPDTFAELFIYKLIKIERLIGFFLDDAVNEIYLDQRSSPIYIDHQYFGRCNTNIVLKEEEVKGLITRLKLEHPISVSSKKPSLKVEFQTKLFHLRISMDFPPLSPNGPSFNIRKLKTNPLKLTDLINFGTLPSFLASYLVEAIEQRKNITIIGEPNAGKTTLANALDLFTPKNWRKIAIEDAIESIDQSSMGYKHLTIQVDSFESNKAHHTKTSEILKLLHRSPDWIYLGEIQSREHTQAMFEALNAGLKGIQTAHSDSVDKILRRWKNLHKIDSSDFMSLDIIIVMRRKITEHAYIRQISEVYEVNEKQSEKKKENSLLNQIYTINQNEKQLLEAISKESFLKNHIDSIINRNHDFQQEIRQKKIKFSEFKGD